jgi:hypothetical protein
MATARKLESKTNAQLVEIYNNLGPAKPIKNWKGKKSVLIEKIQSAQKQTGATLDKSSAPKKAKKAASSGRKKTGAIREFVEAKLQEVAYHENKDKPVGPDNIRKTAGDNTRPVGFSFAEILGALQAEIPEAKTSYACLRWYAVHLRRSGVALPRRPKSSWK